MLMEKASRPEAMTAKDRALIIGAALLALFLGALDALIMSAAMPSIVAELGGLALYSWVYSAYFLARAVSLPIFGKLADMYGTKTLFLFSITLFLVASILAGMADSMAFLVFCRIWQGIGAGGNFALVYIVLSQVSPPEQRAKTLALGSSIWGISSVIGPTLGGFIVSFFSWRWIFFMNIPLAIISLIGLAVFLPAGGNSQREKNGLDLAGLSLFTTSVLGLLFIFIAGGREIAWISWQMGALAGATLLFGALFFVVEIRAEAPMIDLRFFRHRNFALGNGAIFLASFTIFSFFAYVPLYIQGSLMLSPMKVGLAMVSLSLGWSGGAMFYGRVAKNGNDRFWSILGGIVLLVGTLLTLRFHLQTTMTECFLVFLVVGIGMGILSLSTLILVQNCVPERDLGIVTSFHQFLRSLGGAVGVGICGGMATTGLMAGLEKGSALLPAELMHQLRQSAESLLRPDFLEKVPPQSLESLTSSVLNGVYPVFITASITSLACLVCCLALSKRDDDHSRHL